MNGRQEDKLTMAKTTQLLLNQNGEIISAPAAFGTAKTDLDNQIATIDGLVQTQTKQIKGIATDKKSAKEAVISAVLEMIGVITSYAIAVNNNTLKQTVNYSESELRKQRDTVFSNSVLVIRDAAQANLEALADFGVTAATVTNLTTLNAAYIPWIGAPRNASNVRRSATQALVVEFKKLDVILERLDGLAEGKKNTNTDFYNAYQSARVIVDTIIVNTQATTPQPEPVPPPQP